MSTSSTSSASSTNGPEGKGAARQTKGAQGGTRPNSSIQQLGLIHDTTIRNLEPEDSEVLKETDLVVGNSLLWKYRGKKYNTTVIEIYGT